MVVTTGKGHTERRKRGWTQAEHSVRPHAPRARGPRVARGTVVTVREALGLIKACALVTGGGITTKNTSCATIPTAPCISWLRFNGRGFDAGNRERNQDNYYPAVYTSRSVVLRLS